MDTGVDEWDKADQEPAYNENITALRITMTRNWDIDRFSSAVDEMVSEAYSTTCGPPHRGLSIQKADASEQRCGSSTWREALLEGEATGVGR